MDRDSDVVVVFLSTEDRDLLNSIRVKKGLSDDKAVLLHALRAYSEAEDHSGKPVPLFTEWNEPPLIEGLPGTHVNKPEETGIGRRQLGGLRGLLGLGNGRGGWRGGPGGGNLGGGGLGG